MKNTPNAKKQLLFRDDVAIAKNNQGIEISKDLMERIVEAYSAIPGAQPLTTESYRSIFANLNAFTNNIKLAHYNDNWKEKHESIGMDFESGFKMINKTPIPGLERFESIVKTWFGIVQDNMTNYYAGPGYFQIVDGKIEVDQAAVETFIENACVYVESPEELKMKTGLDAMAKIINSLMPIIQDIKGAVNLGLYATVVPGFYDVGLFSEIFDFKQAIDDPGNQVLNASIKVEFFKKYKAHLLKQPQ